MKHMNTLKTYTVVNPLSPKKDNDNEELSEEIKHRLDLIEKAFKKKKFF
jgi:hypothetical protein